MADDDKALILALHEKEKKERSQTGPSSPSIRTPPP
jgi:hypothetical protein